MSKRVRSVVGSALAALPLITFQVSDGFAQDLESFAVISGQSITNTGPTTIVGNIAISPGTSYTGSGSVTQTGEPFLGDAVAIRAQDDLTTLYTFLSSRPTSAGGNLTGQDLGGMTLSPGVYNFDSSANLASNQILTLDGGGDPNATFVINIGSTLTAGSGSSIVLQNGAQGGNVFYRVGSSATLDTSSSLQGQIVALTSVTMNTTAIVGCGALLARNGSVTLDTNTIQICNLDGNGFDPAPTEPAPVTPVPEPVTPVPEPVTPTPDPVAPTVVPGPQAALTKALADHVASGGRLPMSLAILPALQTPEELASSVSQLSGVVTALSAPVVIQGMDSFMDTVIRSGRKAPSMIGASLEQAPRDVGVPTGMVREKIHTPYVGKYGSEPDGGNVELSYPQVLEQRLRNWDVWATGFGSRSVTNADQMLGLGERVIVDSGFAFGLNYAPSDYTNYGIAVAKSVASLELNSGLGSVNSETVFVALRGRRSSERAYIEGALAFGNSDITTDRTVTIAGVDRFVSETSGKSLAAHVEAGYLMGVFTPFIGLQALSFKTPAHAETTVAGSSSYALQYAEATTNSLRSELGVDMQWSKDMTGGGSTSFGLRAAWAHEFASNDPSLRSFQSLPGVEFPVTAVSQDRDSVVISANLALAGANGFSVGAGVGGEFSKNTKDYSASLTASYRW